MATLAELIRNAATQLAPSSTTPRLDAELLLAHTLGWSRARLLAERDHQPTPAQLAAFTSLVARRVAREPVAYLLGQKAFYGLDLLVTPAVLIPRPETELLVELTLSVAQQYFAPRIADIGTGSGAIVIALATHLPNAILYATDLSTAALELAARNLNQFGLSNRVHLLQGDLLAPLPEPIDIIVSNPPYTILAEIEPGVYQYEPHLALDGGGPDGADLYRRLIPGLPAALRPGGAVLLEIGAWQGAVVADLLQQTFPKASVRVHQDLAGHDRIVTLQQP
ncbi:MAG: peptide chain release factor N(5)-glutamine methyltransferase [Oscillochloridaceae bacterium umkhey_bin13]